MSNRSTKPVSFDRGAHAPRLHHSSCVATNKVNARGVSIRSLASNTRDELLDPIGELHQKSGILVVVTNDPQVVIREDRVLPMRDGHIMQ